MMGFGDIRNLLIYELTTTRIVISNSNYFLNNIQIQYRLLAKNNNMFSRHNLKH